MHLGLLECDHVDERFRAIAGGYREMFDALLRPHIPSLRLTSFDVCHGELPAAVRSCEGYLCTGSRASVYEPHAWIGALKECVRGLHRAGRPFVGICFGHQVLAEALGGRVGRSAGGWGIGVHDMRMLASPDWMQPALAVCSLQYMHQDQVLALPPGAAPLARAGHCEIAMFAIGECLGIEGHPEFPAAFNEALMRDRVERIGANRVDDGLASLVRPTHEAVVGAWIARFVRRAR